MQPSTSEEDAEDPNVEDAWENNSIGGWPDLRATERVCHSLFENPPSVLSSPCLVKAALSIAAMPSSIEHIPEKQELHFWGAGWRRLGGRRERRRSAEGQLSAAACCLPDCLPLCSALSQVGSEPVDAAALDEAAGVGMEVGPDQIRAAVAQCVQDNEATLREER